MASQSFYTLMDRVPDTVAWKDRTGLDVTSAGTASNMYVQQDASGAGYYTVNKKAGVSTDWRGLYSSTNYYASRNVAGIYMSFVVSDLTGESVFGLLNADPAASFGDSAAGAAAPNSIASMTFGCWLQSSGVVKLVQNGTYATNLGSVQVGDRIVIECRGPSQGFVYALRNGQIILTATITPSGSGVTYYPGLSFKNTGAAIPVTNLSFGKFTSPMNIPNTITWVDPSGAYNVSGSGTYTIKRTAVAVTGFTRPLYSNTTGYNGFDDSAGFYMSCNVNSTANNQFYFGFAPAPNTNATKINDISYGAFINSTGSAVSVVENGTATAVGTWNSGYLNTITVAYYNNYFTLFRTGDITALNNGSIPGLDGNITILASKYVPASTSVKYYPYFVSNTAANTLLPVAEVLSFGKLGPSLTRVPQTVNWVKNIGTAGTTLDISGSNKVYTVTRGGSGSDWNTWALSDISYNNNFYLKFRPLDVTTSIYSYYQGGFTNNSTNPTGQSSMCNGIYDLTGPSSTNRVQIWELNGAQGWLFNNNTTASLCDTIVVPNTTYEFQCISGSLFTYVNGYLRRTASVNGSNYRALILPSYLRSIGDIEFGTFSYGPSASVPGAPTISAVDASNASVSVSFTAPASNGGSAITSYTVKAYAGGSFTGISAVGASSPLTVLGLTNGTAYTFKVLATNAIGNSAESTASAAATPYTVPGAPTGLGASSITTTGLTLSWSAPTSNGGSALTKYTVSYGATSVDVSANVLSKAITGLAVGTDYTFSVVAVNAAGSSSAATVAATTLKTVTSSTYNAHSVNSITYDITSAFSIPATGNTVRNTATDAIVSASVSGTQLTVTGLAEYTTYTFYVDLSGFERFTTTSARTKDETAPGIVTGFAGTPGNGQIELTWNELVQDAGSAIIGYYIYEGVSGETVLRTVNPLSDTSETFTGLTNGTTYTYRIAAYDTDGNVGNTSTAFATPRTVPGAPTAVSGTADNGAVSVSFSAPASDGGAAISGYSVKAYAAGVYTDISASSTVSPIIVSGLTNGTAYTFTVTATNAAGSSAESTASAAVTPRTVPDAPSGVSGTAGNGQVVVSFTAPASNGGATISGYTVKAYAAGVYTDISASNTASPITVGGLTNGTAYTFTVTATNAAGSSTESTASAAVTPRAVPDAPTIGTATYGNAQATVTWTASASNGGSAITKYTVTSNPGAIAVDVSANATSATVTGLTNGTAYTFTVTATNAAGTSPASSASASVTPRTVPDAPTGVSAVAGNGQATVSFSPPAGNGGSVVTGYTVTSSPGGFTATGASSPLTVTSLINGVAYTFTVKAANDVGSSAASTASSSVTPMDVPTLSASVNENTLTLLASSVIGATSYRFTTGSTVTDISDTKLVRDVSAGSYAYTVRAISSTGVVGAASSAVTVAVLNKPAAVSATVNGTAVDVSFGTVTGATSYNIYSAGKLAATGVTASPYQFTGLTPGPYTYTVRAVNAFGVGPESDAATTVRVLETPTVTATVIGTTITVSVSTNTAATTYALYDGAGADVSSGSSNVFTFTGQSAGSYTFRAKTATASGYSEPSSAVTASVLGAPTDVSATVAGVLITLTGSPVAGATRYMLCDGNGDSIKDLSSNTPSFLVAGKVQQTYTLGMRAVNESGQGPLSATTTFFVYDAPSGVTADVSDTTVRVAFGAVTGISSYGLVNTATGAQVATSATSPFTLTSQTAGTYSYGVRVLGNKLVGVTSSSASVTVLAAPANVIAAESTDASGFKSITVTFDAVTGATGYKLYDATSNALLAEGATASFVRANVTAGSYSYCVRAVNASGTGPASSATAAITIAPPNPPTDVAATSTDLTWVAPATGLVTGYKVYTVVDGAYAFFKSFDAATTSLAKSSLLPSSAPVTYVVATTAPTGDSAYSATSATIAVSFDDVPAASVPLDSFLSTSLNAATVDAGTLKDTLQANVSKFESPVVTIPDLDVGKLVAADTPQSVKDSLASLPVNVILHDPSSNTPVAVSSESIAPGSVMYFPSSEGQTWPMDFGGVVYKMVFGAAGAVTVLDAADAVVGTYNIGDDITLNGRSFVYAASGSLVLNSTLPLASNISGSVNGTTLTVAFIGNIGYSYALYSLSNTPSSDMRATQIAGNYINSGLTGLQEFTLTLSNLTSGQQYNVYVTTLYNTTTRNRSGVVTTTTNYKSVSTPLTVTVLAKPTLSATVNQQTVTLTVGTVTGYTIYDGANVVVPASVSGNVYTLTNVSPAVHSYTVRATATGTVSAPSDAVSVTVLAAPAISSVTVDGTVAFISYTDISNATSYRLCTSDGTAISNISVFGNSFVVPNLSVGTHLYTVRGVYQGSLGPMSNVGSALVLAAPAAADAFADGSTITVSFPAVSGATGYKLYESGVEVTGATLTSTRSITPDTTFTVSDVSAGTYNYTVSATSTNTVSDPSPSTGAVSVVPAPVLSGSANSSTAVLTWTVTDTYAGYIVYNAADDSVVATVTDTTYTDTSLAVGAHSYYVRAYNGSDLGVASNTVTVYVLAASASVTATVSSATNAAATVAVSFSSVSNATGYQVIQSESTTYVGASSPISVTNVVAGTYSYYLRATRDADLGTVVPFTFTVLAAPSITGVSAASDQVTVSFGAVSGATAYRVYSSAGTVKASGSATSLTFTESTSGSYTYYVRAYTASGGYGLLSASSSPVTVTIGPVVPPVDPPVVPCFFGNAPVLTAAGYRRMDSLRAGDRVLTPEGAEATVERVKITQCTASPHTNPYVIPRGRFGAERRVLISPNHKVVTDSGMVEARHLGLEQEAREGSLTYYNLELAGQANMVVGGVAVESLAPVRRMVLTMDQFKAVLQQKYGGINAGVLANIQRTCRFLADGRVEVPVLRR